MHISQFKESKFLTKADCGKGILVTIDHLEQQNVAPSGQPEELKWCLYFKEDINPLVMNSTNATLIAQITGSEETDTWAGHQIVCYNDHTIQFAGKITGGIRCRAPRRAPAPAPAPRPAAPRPAPAPPPPPAAEPEPEEDDVPF